MLDLGQQIAGIGVVVLVGAVAYRGADTGISLQAVVGVADSLVVGIGQNAQGTVLCVVLCVRREELYQPLGQSHYQEKH